MLRIEQCHDCGNSPKNSLVEKVAVALFTNDKVFLQSFLTGLSIWEFRISEQNAGSNQILSERKVVFVFDGMDEHDRGSFQHLRIMSAISHGKMGAVELEWNRDGETPLAESVFIEFQTASAKKISTIRSYS